MKIGVLIYTYNRTDDARINMEIIRNVWKKTELLRDVVIIHAFNGQKEWWSEKYLEDELLYLDNPGHFGGAEILIDGGVKCFQEKYPDLDYLITLASDTWLVMPGYVEKVILGMQKEGKYLATCAWGTKKEPDMFKIGMSLDFNIIDLKWATQWNLFPLRYTEFVHKYSEIFSYQDIMIFPERVFALRFKQAITKSVEIPSENLSKKVAEEHIYRLSEREPVHKRQGYWFQFKRKDRDMYWPNIGLITHHDPIPKQKALQSWHLELGKYGKEFLETKDLGYYNSGFTKTTYIKGDKKLNYEL